MERREEGPDGAAVRKAMWSLAVVLKREIFFFFFFFFSSRHGVFPQDSRLTLQVQVGTLNLPEYLPLWWAWADFFPAKLNGVCLPFLGLLHFACLYSPCCPCQGRSCLGVGTMSLQ